MSIADLYVDKFLDLYFRLLFTQRFQGAPHPTRQVLVEVSGHKRALCRVLEAVLVRASALPSLVSQPHTRRHAPTTGKDPSLKVLNRDSDRGYDDPYEGLSV